MERKCNNFGFLRLLFAILVILAHSPELIDGNRTRELLTRLFGTVSFGTVGVDGFFLISGYLITKSFVCSISAQEYIIKRVLRIYPGYIVAFLFSLIIVGPWAGGKLSELSVVATLARMLTLKTPELQGVFEGMPYQALNGSMWTIAYEFRCYLLVLALGLAGLLSQRALILVATIIAFALSMIGLGAVAHLPKSVLFIIGEPAYSLEMCGVFCCGMLFYLYRDYIIYNGKIACVAACVLIVSLFSQSMAEVALSIFGGYILFWFAFNIKSRTLAAVGENVDLSYGIYLYAFPVQQSLIWLYPGISPWVLFAAATLIAGIFASASWWLIEKPFLNLKTALVRQPSLSRREAPVPVAPSRR